jgi:hypothetical protein
MPSPGCRVTRLAAAAVVLLAAFASPTALRAAADCSVGLFVAGDESGIGGTGLRGDEDGIGGTGFGGDEDGVGGTGLFGTVTAMGSVCVNGLAVEYGPEVPLSVAGKRVRLESLGVGHVVWILASKRDGRLRAESIELFMAWVGRVEAIDAVARTLDVAGETIDVPQGAVVLGRRDGPLALPIGSHVAVSGLRRPSGRIAASRIDAARVDAQAVPARLAELLRTSPELHWLSVEGYLEAPAPGESQHLAGLTVDAASTELGASGEVKGRVWIRGELMGDTLRVERIVAQPRVPGDDAPPRDIPIPTGVGVPSENRGGAKRLDSVAPVGSTPKQAAPPEALGVPDLPVEESIPEIHEVPEIRDVVPSEPGRLDGFDGASGR